MENKGKKYCSGKQGNKLQQTKKPKTEPIAPMPPRKKVVYEVDAANFKDFVQKHTGSTMPLKPTAVRLTPPPLQYSQPHHQELLSNPTHNSFLPYHHQYSESSSS